MVQNIVFLWLYFLVLIYRNNTRESVVETWEDLLHVNKVGDKDKLHLSPLEISFPMSAESRTAPVSADAIKGGTECSRATRKQRQK